jgi:hypothetical protein
VFVCHFVSGFFVSYASTIVDDFDGVIVKDGSGVVFSPIESDVTLFAE